MTQSSEYNKISLNKKGTPDLEDLIEKRDYTGALTLLEVLFYERTIYFPKTKKKTIIFS